KRGISKRQLLCKERVIWLILAERLQRVARLFSGSFCPSGIAGKALSESQYHLINALVDLGSRVELGLSGLQQSNSLSVIPFKSQLGHFDYEGILGCGLRVYC